RQRPAVQSHLAGGIGGGVRIDGVVRVRDREGQGVVSGSRTVAARVVEHSADRLHALRRSRQDGSIYVRLRDRLAAVAGGDSGGGDYDEEENLKAATGF